jgi:hypothetical protein
MFFSVKDAASWAGIVLVGGICFLFGIAQSLADKGRLTLEHSFLIAFVMTVLSFFCFGVEKFINSKEEKLRKIEDAARKEREIARDKLLNDMSQRIIDLQRAAQQPLSPAQVTQLRQALAGYSVLAKTKDEPPPSAAAAIREAMKNIAPTLSGLGVTTFFKWEDITDQLAASDKARDSIRFAADSLVRSAFNLPEHKDDGASEKSNGNPPN